MTFKKGDRIQTEDGEPGEVLFVDKGGEEAQVALKRVSLKFRTETLRLYDPQAASAAPANAGAVTTSTAKKPRRASKR